MTRGQAALEYVIGLAVLLVLSLAVLALLGGIPDFGINIENRHAENFWKEQARPFTIQEANYKAQNKYAYIALENMERESLNLTSIFVNGSQLGFYEYDPTYTDGRGQSALVTPGCTPPQCNYSFVFAPREVRRLATDAFLSADDICGVGGQTGKMGFEFAYRRLNYDSLLWQKAPVGVVLVCVRES